MTECTICERKTDMFLCQTCVTELRTLFVGLPRFLRHLHETAYGQATLTDDGRHTRSRGYSLDGDLNVDAYGATALAVFLSAGRCNPKAIQLLDDVRNTLGTWARHLCESRGITTYAAGTDSLLCGWLARHVSAIAADEAASECYKDISNAVVRIERQINPPIPPRLCGPCPTHTEVGVCGTRLMAPPRQNTVKCPECGTLHEIDALVAKLLADVDDKNFTVQELSVALAALRSPVPVKTLYRWTYELKLTARGWRAGKPVYRLEDARKLSERKRAS